MIEPMSIEGGLMMHAYATEPPVERYKTDKSPQGRKVVFLDENGYDAEREYANKLFPKGTVLTVKEIYVYGSGSDVVFEEYPHKAFNTIMFADVK